jgi:hypothetical protein
MRLIRHTQPYIQQRVLVTIRPADLCCVQLADHGGPRQMRHSFATLIAFSTIRFTMALELETE